MRGSVQGGKCAECAEVRTKKEFMDTITRAKNHLDFLSAVCYDKYQANRITEYPGRQKRRTEAGYIGVGRFYSKMSRIFPRLFVCRKTAYCGVKTGRRSPKWIYRTRTRTQTR